MNFYEELEAFKKWCLENNLDYKDDRNLTKYVKEKGGEKIVKKCI